MAIVVSISMELSMHVYSDFQNAVRSTWVINSQNACVSSSVCYVVTERPNKCLANTAHEKGWAAARSLFTQPIYISKSIEKNSFAHRSYDVAKPIYVHIDLLRKQLKTSRPSQSLRRIPRNCLHQKTKTLTASFPNNRNTFAACYHMHCTNTSQANE